MERMNHVRIWGYVPLFPPIFPIEPPRPRPLAAPTSIPRPMPFGPSLPLPRPTPGGFLSVKIFKNC